MEEASRTFGMLAFHAKYRNAGRVPRRNESQSGLLRCGVDQPRPQVRVPSPRFRTHEKRSDIFSSLITELEDHPELHQRVLAVLHVIPDHVQRDFIEDPRFRVTIDNYVPGQGWTLYMPTPGPIGSGTRCVVLRLKLSHCSEAFAHYVIAHEFAHAFLRNGPWGEILDVEEAADALAATWGFRRPENSIA